jgi:two-component system NtrC family response regulator
MFSPGYADQQIRILVIDDEKGMCLSLKKLLEKEGLAVETACSAREGLQRIQRRAVDLILCDIVMPDMSGLLFLSELGGRVPVIMMTAYASVESARKAFKLGACDYLVKPFDLDELMVVVQQNLLRHSRYETYSPGDVCLHSRNTAFQSVLEMARKFSSTDMPILICGESGTGKEVIANCIFGISERSAGPFIKINCAAIPDTLLESELFGYEKGAFTGAVGTKIGKFEEAHQETLFFDEIGDISLSLQSKLLRVLQDFEFSHLGGRRTIQVDVRVIAASNKDLTDLIQKGRFRDDLYHRLNGVCLRLPPLRERREDIPELVRFFIDTFNRKYGKHISGLDPAVSEVFQSYRWPGNVRELRNCVERAMVICEDERVYPEHIPDSIANMNNGQPAATRRHLSESMGAYRESYLRKVILDALRQTGGNRAEAAHLLTISRKTLYNWMKRFHIRHDFH